MKAQEYIILTIDSLIEGFENLSCVYGHVPYSNSHFIKIPKSFHETNHDFIKSETEIIIDFISRYPFESITFITDEGIIEDEDIIYSKSNIEEPSFVSINFALDSEDLIKTYQDAVSGIYTVNQIRSDKLMSFNPMLFFIDGTYQTNSILPALPTPVSCPKQKEYVTDDSENDFALAA